MAIDVSSWRFESAWRPHRDWEVTLSGEEERIVDEQSAAVDETDGFTFQFPQRHDRIADRHQRWAGDVVWQASEEVRLRAGQEYHRQELSVPTESHSLRNTGVAFGSNATRTTGGVDWDPSDRVSLSLLGHVGSRSRTAPIHDHIKGRRSEMEFISGVVSRKGKELGIPTPCNDAVVELDRQINSGQLKMEAANFERLKKRIAETG